MMLASEGGHGGLRGAELPGGAHNKDVLAGGLLTLADFSRSKTASLTLTLACELRSLMLALASPNDAAGSSAVVLHAVTTPQ